MPRPKVEPRYLLHRGKNLGYARFAGGDGPLTYFPGPYGSPESLAAYAAALDWWRKTGQGPPKPEKPKADGPVLVVELVDEFFRHVREQCLYTKAGQPTSERKCLRAAFRPLARLFPELTTAAFGLEHLDAVRAALIAGGAADSTVRKHLQRVRSLFYWGQGRGLVPEGVRLTHDRGLGRKTAERGRRTAPRRPPDPFAVGAVQLCAPAPLRAMIWLQVLNGCRPGGVCALRPRDVDRSGELWRYVEPPDVAAKTGAEVHWLGPRAQTILGPWLDACPNVDAFAFRPPTKGRARYSVGYYRLAVLRLCRRLGVQHWSPHGLRRYHATIVRRLYGLDAARARLSHANVKTTEFYAERDAEIVRRIAREIG